MSTIITKKKALNICSSLDAVKNIVALHPVYEEIKAGLSSVDKKKGCSSCQASKLMAPLYERAMGAVCSLGKEDILKLKMALNIKDALFAYTSDASGVKLVPLDK